MLLANCNTGAGRIGCHFRFLSAWKCLLKQWVRSCKVRYVPFLCLGKIMCFHCHISTNLTAARKGQKSHMLTRFSLAEYYVEDLSRVNMLLMRVDQLWNQMLVRQHDVAQCVTHILNTRSILCTNWGWWEGECIFWKKECTYLHSLFLLW